ncbi:MAG: hypothetical protein LCI02_22330 [Proteobacteria bacterium]|nr:hypothetical protein [Pseudomonadota bacterium]
MATLLAWLVLCTGCGTVPMAPPAHDDSASRRACPDERTVRAEIVAFEQAYVLNRFGAYVPAGMMYALKRDVVALNDGGEPGPGNAKLRIDKRPRPLVLRVHEGGCLQVTLHNWLAPTWQEEGGQPPEPRVPLGDRSVPAAPAHLMDPPGTPTSRVLKPLLKSDQDAPRTRSASFFVSGLEVAYPANCPEGAICGGDGSYVGLASNQGTFFNERTPQPIRDGYRSGSVIQPGQTSVTLWVARREGSYFAHSMGAPVGGEGDGGQIGLGLFAAVNVEPPQSSWYRSQVTHELLDAVSVKAAGAAAAAASAHPYDTVDYSRLSMLQGREIIHSDLNAIVVRHKDQRKRCDERMGPTLVDGQRCAPAFREFTVILHDEVHAVQAFPELEDEDNPMHYVKDGMGINYGVSSMGSTVYAAQPQRGVGPAAQCPECRAEEFFLSSWANGDPALVLKWDDRGQRPVGARYPDDPSNVHHSYLGDPVVFRNLHAGPKETHVFHLHAHQWVLDASDPNSTYLDSQTISPGATFSYGIEFGGSGNRNLTVGDSIFHCHLYPHFAQGMWELWRVHDVFESGLHLGLYDADKPEDARTNNPLSRSLPDWEIQQGTANPALVPLPGVALAPMPSAAFRGYPFFIPGVAGHRPPQPALDMDVDDPAYVTYEDAPPDPKKIVNGGLPRHVVLSGELDMLGAQPRGSDKYRELLADSKAKGGAAAQLIAGKVAREFPAAFEALAGAWKSLTIKELKHEGEDSERAAMLFHEGKLSAGGLKIATIEPQPTPQWWRYAGYQTARSALAADMDAPQGEAIFFVNGRGRAPGSPYANPCPESAPPRHYRAAFIQTEITVNRHGWFDPQGRIVILEDDIKDVIDADRRTKMPEPLFFRANSGDCITFKSSNFVPSALNADDFQIYTPTDTIGQHIHLVKFDVTSSDGSGNGFNYEDATFSPDEVRERIAAINATRRLHEPTKPLLVPRAHPLFSQDGDIYERRNDAHFKDLATKGLCPPQGMRNDHDYLEFLNREHPYCGAQRTTQRWWADPILVRSGPLAGKDNTLRTVFTHDHFGPSSHQQHGLYAALVIEPANSVWRAELPGDPQARAQMLQACSLTVPEAAAQPAALDDAIRRAFGVRRRLADDSLPAADRQALLAQLPDAQRCLAGALLGGADLAKMPLPSQTTAGPMAPLHARPPLRRDELAREGGPAATGAGGARTDGGPTATRATIVAPSCIDEPDSSPYLTAADQPCRVGEAHQTRREFALAFADFAGVYNLALEPINTEAPRDASMRRFGERQVATQPARPLVISSEDPGTQLVNYRHEPLALRIADIRWSPTLGGFDLSQSRLRADGRTPCQAGDPDCLGDMANAFSSAVHATRERALASRSYLQWLAQWSSGSAPPSALDLVSPAWRSRMAPEELASAASVTRQIEAWRQDFNCALYASDQWTLALQPSDPASPFPVTGPQSKLVPRVALLNADDWQSFCAARFGNQRGLLAIDAAWRVFGDPATPILAAHEGDAVQIRLIQGAQEAQHVFTMHGLAWRRMPDSADAGIVNSQPLGISEHFEFDVRVPDLGLPHADYLYAGSSTDQLWDGMWGTMRALCDPREPGRHCGYDMSGAQRPVVLAERLARVPRSRPSPAVGAAGGGSRAEVAACIQGRPDGVAFPVKSFDVSAVRACELLGNCGQAEGGLVYSRRHGIHDPNAIVYVLNQESQRCQRTPQNLQTQGCFDAAGTPVLEDDAAVLAQRQDEFRHRGRRLEPLVLRAAAGECITVKLRNHLPPSAPAGDLGSALPAALAFHNGLPMIADGFNLNQFSMSHSVGLVAPRVVQNPVLAGGSNIGMNGALQAVFTHGVPPTQGTGSLVAPCAPGHAGSCSRHYVWSATELRLDAQQQWHVEPVEFGGLPLTSFGDAIKHPVHGLVGALVIGKQDSRVCDASGFPGGTSRAVCDSDGKRLYGDHVLLMQDAVSAVQDGFPVPDLKGAEEPDDYGVKAINYKTEPLWARRGGSPAVDFGERNASFDYTQVFSSRREGAGCEAGMKPNDGGERGCDPETPVLQARLGEPLRLHFVHPGGHTRQQGLTVTGHGFHPFPWADDSRRFAPERCANDTAVMPPGCLLWQGVFNGFGPSMGITLGMNAGGMAAIAKDYLLRSQASFLLDGGLWGILRVQSDEAKP